MKNLTKTHYTQLRKAITVEISRGAASLKDAYRVQVLETHWNIGRILTETAGFDDKPSALNREIVERLAKDFGRSDGFFYAVMKFYRLYPVLPKSGLSWSHYVLLLGVSNARERNSLERRAIKEGINAKVFRAIVRCRNSQGTVVGSFPEEITAKKLPCTRGRLYHYQIVRNEALGFTRDQVLVDCGFHFERVVAVHRDSKMHSGHLVTAYKSDAQYTVRIAQFKKTDLYTYQAKVIRVVDGDTLVVRVDLGFESWYTTKLRLRGIDAPEMSSALGQKTKQFVESELGKASTVVVKTYTEDKYGRYLADIFYAVGEDDPALVAMNGIFLNQKLMDVGLATVYGVLD